MLLSTAAFLVDTENIREVFNIYRKTKQYQLQYCLRKVTFGLFWSHDNFSDHF